MKVVFTVFACYLCAAVHGVTCGDVQNSFINASCCNTSASQAMPTYETSESEYRVVVVQCFFESQPMAADNHSHLNQVGGDPAVFKGAEVSSVDSTPGYFWGGHSMHHNGVAWFNFVTEIGTQIGLVGYWMFLFTKGSDGTYPFDNFAAYCNSRANWQIAITGLRDDRITLLQNAVDAYYADPAHQVLANKVHIARPYYVKNDEKTFYGYGLKTMIF